jgi:hypothetical protein
MGHANRPIILPYNSNELLIFSATILYMITIDKNEVLETGLPKSRLYVGGVIFIMGFLSPLLVPLITGSPLPVGWKTAISGLLIVGIPELTMLVAAAVMGKAGFDFLKQWLFNLLKKHLAPPETVSPTRYLLGLILFSIPLLYGWIAPYLVDHILLFEQHHMEFAIIGDLLLFCSLFVLGGEFWDKLRALFIYKTKVSIIE